jgi:hypothetical protein
VSAKSWYVSSAAWTAITQWSASRSGVTVGTIVRPLTGSGQNNYMAFVASAITTGVTGSSEPSWPSADSGTVTDGGVTWENITGQSGYGWAGCAGDVGTITGISNPNRIDPPSYVSTIYVDSAQAETGVNDVLFFLGTVGAPYPFTNLISVNVAGNVPPQQSDYVPFGASFSTAGNFFFFAQIGLYGCNLTAGTGGNGGFEFGCEGNGDTLVQDGILTQASTGDNHFVSFNGYGSRTIWRNVKVVGQPGANTSNFILLGTDIASEFVWLDTADPFHGVTPPTAFAYLFVGGSMNAYCRGVDFSGGGSGLALAYSNNLQRSFLTLEECTVYSLSNLYSSGGYAFEPGIVLTLVNCDTTADNTNYNNMVFRNEGTIATSTATYLSGGGSVEGAPISYKMVGAAGDTQPSEYTLDSFILAADNSTTGASVTATVQVLGAASLNNTDVALELYYQGSTSSPRGSRISSQPDVIPVSAALASSAATWVGAPGGSVAQQLQVTFTPQKAGVICARLRVSTNVTLWYDPVLTVV